MYHPICDDAKRKESSRDVIKSVMVKIRNEKCSLMKSYSETSPLTLNTFAHERRFLFKKTRHRHIDFPIHSEGFCNRVERLENRKSHKLTQKKGFACRFVIQIRFPFTSSRGIAKRIKTSKNARVN